MTVAVVRAHSLLSAFTLTEGPICLTTPQGART
jgi:hypothetical protein